jgi:hypothetical protein
MQSVGLKQLEERKKKINENIRSANQTRTYRARAAQLRQRTLLNNSERTSILEKTTLMST